jgi:dTMP kinase
LLLHVPLNVSEARRQARNAGTAATRDRFEEAERAFFERVERGYLEIARLEPKRVRVIDATPSPDTVTAKVWEIVAPLVGA